MNKVKTLLISASIVLASTSFADGSKVDSGEKLYKANCAVCHGTTGGMDTSKRVAPPIAAVRMHYIGTYSDEDSFVKAVSDWVKKPEESKTMMRGAIRKFNLMPQLSVSKADAETIASYIYAGELDSPKGFKEHVEKEHGKKGMGIDQGKHKGQGKKHKQGMDQ